MKTPHKSPFMLYILYRFKLLMVNISIFFLFLGNFTWIVFRPIFFCYEKQGMNFRLGSSRDFINQLFWSNFFFFLIVRVLFEGEFTNNCMLTVIVTLECLPLSKFYWASDSRVFHRKSQMSFYISQNPCV